MQPTLSLIEDIHMDGAEASWPATPRMLFVVQGAITIDEKIRAPGQTWHGDAAVSVTAGRDGATVWRWELTHGTAPATQAAGVRSLEKLAAPLQTFPEGGLLLRGDSVSFPQVGAPTATFIRGRASVASSRAVFASTCTAAPPPTGRAAPGLRRAPILSSPRRQTDPAGSFAS